MTSATWTVLAVAGFASVLVVVILSTRGSVFAARLFASLALVLAVGAGIYLSVVAWHHGTTLAFSVIPTALTLLVVLGTFSEGRHSFAAFTAGSVLILGGLFLLFTAGFFYLPASAAVLATMACWPRRPLSEWS